MSLLPIIQPQVSVPAATRGLYREVAWDYERDKPIYRNGEPVIVTGKDAVLVWAWNALKTARFRHEIFTWAYGNDVESLIGQPFTEALKQAEAVRYVRECLLINPYITDVTNVEVSFAEDTLTITGEIKTVYGEVIINV